jgi:2-polyprenyl-3-methyl-5-hydroxy-6-metoxy-1,4-benzoquinol methylase
MEDKIAVNQKLWDSRVAGHAASTFYDVPGFLAGKCMLMPAELEALGNVEGKSLLHLQCHFGLDTLSWARRGARVTGMDFSGAAIAKARSLATEAGLEATFVEASVYDLPAHLIGQFDIVFTSYGTITWLPDLERWADVVNHFLKPGGKFCIAEVHPQWYSLNWETYQIDYPYFNTGEAFEEEATTSYAGTAQDTHMKEYFWCHSLSEIIQPLLDRGLMIQQFREYPYCYYNCFPNLQEVRPGQYVPKGLAEGKVPMMFMLLAIKS